MIHVQNKSNELFKCESSHNCVANSQSQVKKMKCLIMTFSLTDFSKQLFL